jgi:hypothetical protein
MVHDDDESRDSTFDEDRHNNVVSPGRWCVHLQLLLEMPTFGGVLAAAPGGYVKLVSREMGKAEALLKVILSPVEGLCDTFRALLPDSPTADFKTVLDLKGLKKSEQTALTEEWSRRAGVASLSRPAAAGTHRLLFEAHRDTRCDVVSAAATLVG